ncbi:MAG: pyruvate ferredoxin oxidoreductase [bacterium]
MKKVLTGNQAVAWGVMCARAQVISAYPITPQTTIIEELADLVDQGLLNANFIKVESEHSAMAGCIGAQAAGARTFTATSAQGLALMHELLHWAALGRLPIVMADVNRAMAPGWSIWTDQNDSLAQRDTGWMQFYCETVQEVLDTVIQAYRIAEQVNLPAMLVLDAFFLSHTSEAVDIPGPDATDQYLPPYRPTIYLNVDDPHAFGGIVPQDIYMEFRYKMELAMQEAIQVAKRADEEFRQRWGRGYGLLEPYRCEDAEFILATSGSVTSTARMVVDDLRRKGQRVGVLKLRLLRPLPKEEIWEIVKDAKKIAFLYRKISVVLGGIWAKEIKSALYGRDSSTQPIVLEYIAGLGGRDITPQTILEIVEDGFRRENAFSPVWIGLKR